MKINQNEIRLDRDELAEILKKHFKIEPEVECRVNYGNAGFSLCLTYPDEIRRKELKAELKELDK